MGRPALPHSEVSPHSRHQWVRQTEHQTQIPALTHVVEVPACEAPTYANPDGRTGTRAGYNAHTRAGQTPCDACRRANAVRSLAETKRNRTQLLARRRLWNKTNGASLRRTQAQRRLMMLHGHLIPARPPDIDDWSTCRCCGATDHIDRDHIVPLARWGAHDERNLQPLCRSCNASKSDGDTCQIHNRWLGADGGEISINGVTGK